MKKFKLFIILLLPLLAISQTQLRYDIEGEAASDFSGYSVSIVSDGSHVALGPTLISLLQLKKRTL